MFVVAAGRLGQSPSILIVASVREMLAALVGGATNLDGCRAGVPLDDPWGTMLFNQFFVRPVARAVSERHAGSRD
jgi:hypothetical protein